MPLPVLPGVVRASVGGPIAGGSRWSNTWHFRRLSLSDPTAAQIAQLHTDLMNFYGGTIMTQTAPGTSLADGQYTPLDGSSGAYVLPAGIVGTGGADALPAEVAEVMTLRTAQRGRRHRGRIFLPALAENVSDGNGLLAASMIGNLASGMGALIAALATNGWELGVASYGVSRKVNYTTTPKTYVVSTWTPEFTPVTSVTYDNHFDVIRNRKN